VWFRGVQLVFSLIRLSKIMARSCCTRQSRNFQLSSKSEFIGRGAFMGGFAGGAVVGSRKFGVGNSVTPELAVSVSVDVVLPTFGTVTPETSDLVHGTSDLHMELPTCEYNWNAPLKVHSLQRGS